MKNILIDNLIELKSSFGATGVKAEFESEGATFEEVKIIKELADNAGLEFSLKTGGCEALRDLKDACLLGVSNIVAPMVESEYAFEKFINSAANVMPAGTNLFINIETITGFDALDSILQNNLSQNLTGIVFGRTDFSGSLNIKNVEDNKILKFAQKAAQKAVLYNKKFILGGGISSESIPFINHISPLSGVETRKIIFGTKKLDTTMIEKAINFEINWLKYKQTFSPNPADSMRIRILAGRCKELNLL